MVSQFISTKAAISIFNKIRDSFNSEYLNENHFEKLNINQIKKLGLSTNKSKETIKELSNLFLNNKNDDLSKLNAIDLNERLLSVFGIGPWSLNMYEIFLLAN